MQIHEWRLRKEAEKEQAGFNTLFKSIMGIDSTTRHDLDDLKTVSEEILRANEGKPAAIVIPEAPKQKRMIRLSEDDWKLLENPKGLEGEGIAEKEDTSVVEQTIQFLAEAQKVVERTEATCKAGFTSVATVNIAARFGSDPKDKHAIQICEQARALVYFLNGMSYSSRKYQVDNFSDKHGSPADEWLNQVRLYAKALSDDEEMSGKLRMCLDLLPVNSGAERALVYSVGCATFMQIGAFNAAAMLEDAQKTEQEPTTNTENNTLTDIPKTET